MLRPGEGPHLGPRAGWSQACGALDLAELPRETVAPEERAAIEALLARYCWALDEQLPALLGECFAADAVWEGRVEEARLLPRLEGRARIVARHRDTWAPAYGQTRHFLDSALIGRLGERAAVAVSRLLVTRAEGAGARVVGSGFHRAALTAEDGRWEILRLDVGYDGPGLGLDR